MNPEIWKVLDVEPVRDRDAIRRAYARRLKVTSPEDDADGFRALREAYDEALASLNWDWAWNDDDLAGDPEAEITGVQATISLDQLHAMLGGRAAPIAFSPPPAFESDSEHARAVEALEALVLAEPGAEPAAIEAALAAVMASPAMETVAIAAQTEQRIAHLIAQNAPRADALVRPAINAFRWSRERVRIRHDGLEDAVLDRDADIIFRNGLMRDEGPRRTAFLALSRPLDQGPAWHDRFWPGFDAAMRDVLGEIDMRRSSLLADLNPDSLAHWRAHMERPRLATEALWAAALAPLAAAMIALFSPVDPLTKAAAAYVAGVVVILAAASAWSFGILPLRRQWRDSWDWRAPGWVRFGWAPASTALLLLSALAPVNVWATAGVGLCAAVLVLWAVVTSEIEPGPTPGTWPLPMKLLVSQGMLVAWWGFLMTVAPEATPPAATAAFAGAAIASAVGVSSLPILWYRWTVRPLRFALVLALAGATIWTVLQLLDPSEATGGAAMAAAATAAVVLAHRPAAGGLGSTALQWRYRIQAFSALGMIGAGAELGWLKISGLWLLAGVVVALIGAVVVEKDL